MTTHAFYTHARTAQRPSKPFPDGDLASAWPRCLSYRVVPATQKQGEAPGRGRRSTDARVTGLKNVSSISVHRKS